MKKIKLTLGLLLISILNVYSQQDSIPETDTTKNYFDTISRVNLGIYGNWNYNTISNINKSHFEDIRSTSFEFGMEVRYRISKKVSFDIGAGYSKLPTLNFKCEECKFSSTSDELVVIEDKSIQYARTSLLYSMLRIPFGFRYNFSDDYNSTISISAGVSFLIKPIETDLRQYLYRGDTVFDIEAILPYLEKEKSSFVTQYGYYFTIGKSFNSLKNIDFQIDFTYQYLPKYYYIRNSNVSLYGIKLELFF